MPNKNAFRQVSPSILDCIGNTPLIHLSRYEPTLNFNLYAKCEMFNPSLSIKDRIVHRIIQSLEKEKKLKPGMTIVEASSGNTGTSLAMIGTLLGYKVIVTVPHKTSREKIKTMELFGAEVHVCASDVDVYSDEHYINKAQILAKKPNTVLLGQYESRVNVETHAEQTAGELWEQMDGKIDCVIATASSGGTITGIARALKAHRQDIKIIMPDPIGSVFFHYFQCGDLQCQPKSYQIEGAGKDTVCPIHDFTLIDNVIPFSDAEAFAAIKKLARTEGIIAGGSSGGTLVAAERLMADKSLMGKNVVVILPDSGFKYLSKDM